MSRAPRCPLCRRSVPDNGGCKTHGYTWIHYCGPQPWGLYQGLYHCRACSVNWLPRTQYPAQCPRCAAPLEYPDAAADSADPAWRLAT